MLSKNIPYSFPVSIQTQQDQPELAIRGGMMTAEQHTPHQSRELLSPIYTYQLLTLNSQEHTSCTLCIDYGLHLASAMHSGSTHATTLFILRQAGTHVECGMQAVPCRQQMVPCRTQTIRCGMQTVPCEMQKVTCEGQTPQRNADRYGYNTDEMRNADGYHDG